MVFSIINFDNVFSHFLHNTSSVNVQKGGVTETIGPAGLQ